MAGEVFTIYTKEATRQFSKAWNDLWHYRARFRRFRYGIDQGVTPWGKWERHRAKIGIIDETSIMTPWGVAHLSNEKTRVCIKHENDNARTHPRRALEQTVRRAEGRKRARTVERKSGDH